MAKIQDLEQLRLGLDALARRARGLLRRAAMGREARRPGRVALLLVVPGLVTLGQLARLAMGWQPWSIPVWQLILLTLAPPMVSLLAGCGRCLARPIGRRDALGVFDAKLKLANRLVTADQFLTAPQVTGFMAAAVEDAQGFARRARSAEVHLGSGPGLARGRAWGAAALALALLILATWLDSRGVGEVGTSATVVGVFPTSARPAGTAFVPDPSDPRPRREPRSKPLPVPGLREATVPGERLSARAEHAVGTEGRPGAGAASASGLPGVPNQAGGIPTNGGPPSRASAREEQSSTPVRAPSGPSPLALNGAQRVAISAAGTGMSRGQRDPMASDWVSRQGGGAPDDEAMEDEQLVRDEAEDQQARGGVQPNLRDRRPGASRELQIGFGSDKNPDANGRGGPSQPKKSRGVASLVLGVPIPDMIKGQPNPGRAAATQERIAPTGEESDPQPAGLRRPRQTRIGALSRPELTLWMRDLIRTYFLQLRSSNLASPREGQR
jgi:hypothetical protein